jgi:hypothetical protein
VPVESQRSDFDAIADILREADNPFDSDKVLHARDPVIDVPKIHEKEYRKLTKELDRVRNKGRSRGVLVTGVPGSGKSHLIARLYRDRPKDVLFFQVQALPGGTSWLRHILQCMVGDLSQPVAPEDDTPQLTLLIRHFIEGTRETIGGKTNTSVNLADLDKALEARRSRIEAVVPDPVVRDVLTVLVNLWQWQMPAARRRNTETAAKKTRLAVNWLKGMMVDDKELEIIGAERNLGEDEETGEINYLTALRVLGMLTEGQAPIILAFDQLDTMTDETINAFGRQLLHLIGSDSAAPNYLVVTAGIKADMQAFIDNRVIPAAAPDVIFKTKLELPALAFDRCLDIAAGRLSSLFTLEQRARLPNGAGRLFPFDRAFFENRLQGPVIPSPRRVMNIARNAFDEASAEADVEWLMSWPDVEPIRSVESAGELPNADEIARFLEKELESRKEKLGRPERSDEVHTDLLAPTIERLTQEFGERSALKTIPLPKGAYKKPTPAFFALSDAVRPDIVIGLAENSKNHWASVKATLSKSKHLLDLHSGFRVLFVRSETAKSIDRWKPVREILPKLQHNPRFDRYSVTGEDLITIAALDSMRRDLKDLIFPQSRTHREHQIQHEDLAGFICGHVRLFDTGIFTAVRRLMNAEAEPPLGEDAKYFVYARVEAKKVIAMSAVENAWAKHNKRAEPTGQDRELLRKAAARLADEGKIIITGPVKAAILKKS